MQLAAVFPCVVLEKPVSARLEVLSVKQPSALIVLEGGAPLDVLVVLVVVLAWIDVVKVVVGVTW